MNDEIEMVLRCRIPVKALKDKHPDAKYEWDYAKAESKAISNGEQTLADILAFAQEHGKVKGDIHPNMSTTTLDVLYTLERALPFVNRDVIRDATDAVMQCLGYEEWGADRPLPSSPTGPDAALLSAIKELVDFQPEFGYPEWLAEKSVEEGWANDVSDELERMNDPGAWEARQNGDPIDAEVPRKSDPSRTIKRRVAPDRGRLPFLSQAIYYPILGKEDGRSLSGRVDKLRKLAGMGDSDV